LGIFYPNVFFLAITLNRKC